MSERIVYYWEVYCQTDSKYEYVWSEDEPTVCPINNAHTISTNPGPRIIDSVSNHTVKIKEEDGETQGLYKLQGFIQNIPSGDPGNITSFEHTWPYPVSLLNGWLFSSDELLGDIVEVTAADSTVIGALAAPLYTGNTEMTVTGTVLDNIYKGYKLDVTDGANVSVMGYITDIDTSNAVVTMNTACDNNYSPISPTYVRLTVPVIENFYISTGNGRFAFAEKKVGGRYTPANIPTCIHYKNNSGNAKVFSYNIEILY